MSALAEVFVETLLFVLLLCALIGAILGLCFIAVAVPYAWIPLVALVLLGILSCSALARMQEKRGR